MVGCTFHYVSTVTVKCPRRLFPTTGKFMNEAVNDKSLYFHLLITVKPSAKQELFATDTRLLLMYIRKSNKYTDQRAAIVYF